MSENFRYKYGDTNPVVTKAVQSAIVIELGDLVGQDDSGDVYPASHATWYGTEANFQTGFLGVAMQRSRTGDVEPIRVATSGVFQFDCDSASFELGDLVSPKDGGSALEDQTVAAAPSGEGTAIGRVAKRTSSETTVLVEIVSTIMVGGVQAQA